MSDWDCTAYGPELREVGALCFFADLNERVCSSREECHTKMAAERQRVFRRINELSAAGDPAGAYLEGEFSNPAQLLDSAGTDDGAPSFTCPRCGATSHHPKDVQDGYCGRCHDWTGESHG